MSDGSMSSAPQQTDMRKGTRSCFECRKRKLRCIYQQSGSKTCTSCLKRKLECVEQSRKKLENAGVDKRLNQKGRVAKLESIIKSLKPNGVDHDDALADAPRSVGSSATDVNSSILSDSTPMDSVAQNIDPIVSLFNNAIWRSRTPESDGISGPVSHNEKAPTALSSRALEKRARTCKDLLSGLPSVPLLERLLNATCSWWNTWKSLGSFSIDGSKEMEKKSLQDYVALAFQSDDPSIVALGVHCIMVCIQQLDAKVNEDIIRELPRLPGELFQHYFEKIDSLIVHDSDYASTKEGIAVILMSRKTLMNLGLIKKAWVYNRRAITFAQLLGMNKLQQLSQSEKPSETSRRHKKWIAILNTDIYISLLLGLPYASDPRFLQSIMASESDPTTKFQHNLMKISARVIERNQMDNNLQISEAELIKNDLDAAAGSMGKEWWNCSAALALNQITRDEYLERLSAQLWYNQIRVCLYMPLMIQSLEDNQLDVYRLACLQASRDFLEIHHIMRADSESAFNMVKIIDFQAFLSGGLLILGVLGYGRSSAPNSLVQQEEDRAIVGKTLDILRQTSTTQNNVTASQAVQGLETLMLLGKCSALNHQVGLSAAPVARIVVPYSGTITISPGKFLTDTNEESPQSKVQSTFTLSHGIFQFSAIQDQNWDIGQDVGTVDAAISANLQDFPDSIYPELPSIGFDWGNMLNMNLEEDWAWLNDINNIVD